MRTILILLLLSLKCFSQEPSSAFFLSQNTQCNAAPLTPLSFTTTARTCVGSVWTITLSWAMAANATTYIIKTVGTPGSGTATYTVTTLKAKATFCCNDAVVCNVAARNACGLSVYSATVTFNTGSGCGGCPSMNSTPTDPFFLNCNKLLYSLNKDIYRKINE